MIRSRPTPKHDLYELFDRTNASHGGIQLKKVDARRACEVGSCCLQTLAAKLTHD